MFHHTPLTGGSNGTADRAAYVELDADLRRARVRLHARWRDAVAPGAGPDTAVLAALEAAETSWIAARAAGPPTVPDAPSTAPPHPGPVADAAQRAWGELDGYRRTLAALQEAERVVHSSNRQVGAIVHAGRVSDLRSAPGWWPYAGTAELEAQLGDALSTALRLIRDTPRAALEQHPALAAAAPGAGLGQR